MKLKSILYTFFALVCLSLLTPLIVDKNYLFPFILPRALFLRITLDLAFPLYLYLILSKKEYRPNMKNPLNLAVLAFLVINFIASFTGVNIIRSVWGNIERMGGAWYLAHLTLLYFYVLLIAQASSKLLLRFLKFFLWISIASVLYGVWVYMGLPGFYADPSLPARVSSSFGNPIFFASFLILPLFLTIFFALQEEELGWKIIYWIAAILQLFGIYQSATRGAFVGLIIGVFIAGVIYLFKAPTKRLKLFGAYGIAGMVVVIGLLFTLGSKLPASSFLYRITHLKDNNSSARIIQWKTALEGFKEKPALGVGPENYYIIANKFYNPEMNKYDASWFDKPHNYILEILVTTGIAGFAAYMSVLVFSAWALLRAYRAGLFSWLEACVLLAGMLAYQIQNIFVFDTISASVTFFVYLGFAAYLWYEADLAGKKINKPQNFSGLNPAFVNTVLAVSTIATVYGIYLTNVMAGRVAKNINYGYAYSTVDPVKAGSYFETARSQPFVFDPGELGTRYSDFASNLAQNPPKEATKEQVNKILDQAIASLQEANLKMDNYPIFWYKLAQVLNAKSMYNQAPMDPQANQAAEKAVEFAPTRPETLTYLAQVRLMQGNTAEAIEIANKMVQLYPWSLDIKWRLALIYHIAKDDQKAAPIALEALASGYSPNSAGDFQWLPQYYVDQKDYNQAASLYEQAIQKNPNDVQLYANLATVYAKMGNTQKAIETANKITVVQPSAKADVEAFINSLK